MGTKHNTWLKAAMLSKKIRKRGVTLPPSDVLIGQLAIENSFMIMTVDDHFKKIPGVELVKTELIAR